MSVIFSDHDIAVLLKEKKALSADYRTRIQVRPKRGHKERELDIKGGDGSDFRLILRQSLFNLTSKSMPYGHGQSSKALPFERLIVNPIH